ARQLLQRTQPSAAATKSASLLNFPAFGQALPSAASSICIFTYIEAATFWRMPAGHRLSATGQQFVNILALFFV
ncbi:hypothetical protein, partial [Pseudomonas sp. GM18]|uniref:hypothetical protein n=1 Tax=Pseudomonas sp. GM18 TaxID=1144324 RepID=UPI001EE68C44